ncbi:MAG: PQQ-binding-like beta-propeller repeat protein [Spirochaetota bacterium]
MSQKIKYKQVIQMKHYSILPLLALCAVFTVSGCFDSAEEDLFTADDADRSIFGTLFGSSTSQQNYSRVYSSGQDRIISLSDGSYLMATGKDLGTADGGLSDISIVKLNSDGTVAWSKALGDDRLERNPRIIQTIDGGFAVAGEFKSTNDQRFNYFIVKMTYAGEIEWQQAYDLSAYDTIGGFTQSADGSYIIAGQANLDTDNALVICTDSTGALTWQKTFPYDFSSAAAASDGSIYLAGSTIPLSSSLPVTGYWDLAVVKLASDGSLLWSETFGETKKFTRAADIAILPAGDLIIGGEYTTASSDGSKTYGDFFFIRLGSDGAVKWQKALSLSCDERIQSIKYTNAGKIIAAGYYYNSAASNAYDVLAVQITADGAVEWQKRYNYGNGDLAGEIALRSDGGYVIGGTVFLNIKADGSFPYSPSKLKAAATSGKIYSVSLGATQRSYAGSAAECSVFDPSFALKSLSVTIKNL